MSRVEVCGPGKSGLWKAVVGEKETNTAIPVAVPVFFLNEFDTDAVFNATVCFSGEL